MSAVLDAGYAYAKKLYGLASYLNKANAYVRIGQILSKNREAATPKIGPEYGLSFMSSGLWSHGEPLDAIEFECSLANREQI